MLGLDAKSWGVSGHAVPNARSSSAEGAGVQASSSTWAHPSVTTPHNHRRLSPEDISLAGQLVRLTALELVQSHRARESAWSYQIFGGQSQSQAWTDYAQEIETQLSRGIPTQGALLALIHQAPHTAGTPLQSFLTTFQMAQPSQRARALLRQAKEYAQSREFPALTQAMIQLAAKTPETQGRAKKLQTLIAGGGSIGERIGFDLPHFTEELLSPISLLSFAAAIKASRLVSLGVLSRSRRLGLGTLLASEGLALGVEVPTLVTTRRLGMQMFVGGEGLLAPDSIAQEILVTYGPFAMLKGAGLGMQRVAPAWGQIPGFRQTSGELNSLGRATFESARLGTEFSAVLAGNVMTQSMFSDGAHGPEQNLIYSSLMTVAHMRAASHLVDRLFPGSTAAALMEQRSRLLRNGVEDIFVQGKVPGDSPLRPRLFGEINGALSNGSISSYRMDSWVRRSQQGQSGRVAEDMSQRGLPLLSQYFLRLPGRDLSSSSDLGFHPGLAMAGMARGRVAPFSPSNQMYMKGTGENGSAEGSANNKNGKPKGTPPGKGQAIALLIHRRLEAMVKNADKVKSEKRLDNAARLSLRIWDRLVVDPAARGEETFETEYRALGEELAAAKRNRGELRRRIQELEEALSEADSQRPEAENPAALESLPPAAPLPAVIEKPRGLLSRLVVDPLGKLILSGRDRIVEAVVSRMDRGETPAREEKVPSGTGEAEPVIDVDLPTIRRELKLKKSEESDIQEMIQELDQLYKLMGGSNLEGINEGGRELLFSLLHRINESSGGKLYLQIPQFMEKAPFPADVVRRSNGAVMGLGIRPELGKVDSPLAESLRMGGSDSKLSPDIELDYLHQSILEGAYGFGGASRLHSRLRRLAEESQVDDLTGEAMLLMGESIYYLVQGRWTPDNLLGKLELRTQDGSMEASFQSLKLALDPKLEASEALAHIGNNPEAVNYLMTGLYTLVRSQGKPDRLSSLIQRTGPGESHEGFHPTIGTSLFGAAHGADKLSKGLFVREFEIETFLQKARQEFSQGEN